MRARMAAWLAWLLAVTAAPGASAEHFVERYEVDVGLETAVHTVVHRYNGTEAMSIRSHLDDDHGNHDGMVSAAEVRAYQDHHTITYRENGTGCYEDFDLVRIEGAPPVHTRDKVQRIRGAEGNDSSRAPVWIETAVTYEFPSGSGRAADATVRLRGNDVDRLDRECVIAAEKRPPSRLGEGFGHWAWEFDIFSDNYDGLRVVVPIEDVVHPLPGHSLDARTLSLASAKGHWDGEGWRAAEATAPLSGRDLTFVVVEGTVQYPEPFDPAPYAAVGLPLGLLALLGFAWWWEPMRLRLLYWFVVAPGFTRIEEDQVLLNRRREEILLRIRESPGITFSELRRASDIPNGPLVYHLRVLATRGHVRHARDGARARYFPRIPGAAYSIPLSAAQSALFAIVESVPGIVQRDLAARLGWSRLAVHRHGRRLAQLERVRIVRDGRLRRYFPAASHHESPAAASAGRSPRASLNV
ncbi:MAG: hypothetical protein HYT80_09825 [Euryarchaeota archaeon]|nr:hypothetical protein [Euryarchaeota archaeon]